LIQGSEITIRTDHRPLSFVKAGGHENRKLARWWAILQSYNFTIEYVPGKTNVVADALSRLSTAKENIMEDTLSFHYQIEGGSCKECGGVLDDTYRECAKCGGKVHEDCCSADHLGLVFFYCNTCLPILDWRDPA
jgi:hypothetical protein